jgi:glycosyltransferase involved in cell wall biosynthesis
MSTFCTSQRFRDRRAAVVVFSHYPSDPRPRRAAEALAQQGMSVDVICLKMAADEARRETFNGVNVLRLPMRHRRGGKLNYVLQYAAFLLAAFTLLTYRCLSRGYHLVHVHNMPDVLVFSALFPKLLGAKVILDLHDPMPELMTTIFGMAEDSRAVRWLKRFEKWSTSFADAVITVNLACKRIFTARSCPANKLRVVMNAPDDGLFQYREVTPTVPTKRDPHQPFVLMYHGSLVERHGLDLAVQAVEMMKERIPNMELRVYGRSTEFLQQVMKQVAERGLESRVRYLGAIPLEQIVSAIDQCDVGVIPNRRSLFTEINTPTRIFEYLARGKPVIAPMAGGIRDYFGEDDLIYFNLGDAQDLARQMEFAYRNPGAVRQITSKGQAIYLAHCWKAERARFLDLTCELLGGAAVEPKPRAVEAARSEAG